MRPLQLDVISDQGLPDPVNARLVVIANACQTVGETLDHYRLTAADPEVLERNNSHYLDRYVGMIPRLDGQRREIVDAVNHCRSATGIDSFISEHNSCSLNGVYLFDLLCRHGYADRVSLVDNMDLESDRARELVSTADVVLLSSTFITSAATIVRVTRVIKDWHPGVKVVVGGAKLTQFAQESEIHEAARAADALVLSPNGERTMLAVIGRLYRGESITDLPNLALDDGNGFLRTRSDPHDGLDLDANAVHWDTLPPYVLRSSVNIRTGRGCPFKCKFCTFPSYNDQKVDLMSVDTVIAQLRRIMRLPSVRSVRFVDDTLFLNRKHLISVCQGMMDIGFDKPWTAYLRSTTLTEECTRYLREAGCRLVLVGVESADQVVLNNMLKGTKEAHNWAAAKNLRDNDILGFAFILTGFPGETSKSVDKTIDFLNNSGIHSYVHSPLFVFPNSPVSKEAQNFGLSGGFNDWAHPTMNCRQAIDECARIFTEVTNAAYIDRGSSVTKILLDHGYSVDEVTRLGVLHNSLAREELAGGQRQETLDQFRRLAGDAAGAIGTVDEFTSPYRRSEGPPQVNSSARY
jgi:p-methyltransferase